VVELERKNPSPETDIHRPTIKVTKLGLTQQSVDPKAKVMAPIMTVYLREILSDSGPAMFPVMAEDNRMDITTMPV